MLAGTSGTKSKGRDCVHHFSGRKELNAAAKSSGLGARTRDGWNCKETDNSCDVLSTVAGTWQQLHTHQA